MKILFFIVSFIFILPLLSQQKKGDYYEFKLGAFDDSEDAVYFDDDIVYLPKRNPATHKIEVLVYNLVKKQEIQKYHPPKQYASAPGFAIDNGFIYLHTDWTITKVNMKTNVIEWEKEYASGMAAQIGPILFENHIAISLNDLILVLDKDSGNEYIKIKGKSFDQDITLTENYLVYGKFNGPVNLYDVKEKKVLFKVDVGVNSGSGVTEVGNNLVFPSSNVKINCVDAKTGKEVWVWNSEEIKGGCGHGFNDAPALIEEDLYVCQRETGLYKFNAKTGAFLKRYDFDEEVSTEWVEYKNKLIITGVKHLFSFNPVTEKIETIASFKEFDDAMPTTSYSGRYLSLDYIGWEKLPKVMVFDLKELVK